MSFTEVKELRKAGKIDEALRMAKQDLENEPDDIWNKRSIAWVYYVILKSNASLYKYSEFSNYLKQIRDLNLPEDEKMIFDTVAFQVGKLIFEIQKVDPVDYNRINEVFEIIKDFSFTKPSEAYSFIYKAFHKGYRNWTKYLDFADWWDFENFLPQDYLQEEFNGKKQMAIAENAYIAYPKKLLEGIPTDETGYRREVDKEKILAFMPKLDKIVDDHPEYQYPAYFKAKLLLDIGEDDDVLSSFLPFAKKKQNDFWVWELLAEVFHDDVEKQISCLSKALSLRTPDDFLVRTRQKMAELMINQNKYQEAKTEIIKVLSTREKNGWRIPNQVREWTEQSWYGSTEAQSDNSEFYNDHKQNAEEVLFNDVPEEIVVVEFVNEKKKMLNFVKDRTKHGFFNYSSFLSKPNIGQVLKVRMKGDGNEGFFKALTLKTADDGTECPALKTFEGPIKIIENAVIGFVDDVFFDPGLIQRGKFGNGEFVKGKAVLSFNKKKGEWGWKAIELL